MNCSKCGAELLDGAKFCAVCGAPANPADQKRTCSKCGLELSPSAKFCPVCGTPAAAVSTPEPTSENLVAAMQAAAQEALSKEASTVGASASDNTVSLDKSPAATATASVPAPADPFAIPSNMIPQPTDSFGANRYNGTAPQPAPLGDGFSSDAAAAVVTPIKKKNKAGIIIAAAAALVVIAAAVVFFAFRGPMMNLFMGNSGYAAMIEGNGISSTVKALDNPALAAGINAAAGSGIQAFASYTASDIEDNYNDDLFGQTGSMNLGTVVSAVKNYLSDGFNSDGVTVTASANIDLTDTAKSLISSDAETIAETEKVISAINDTELTYSVNASDTAAAFGLKVKDSALTADARGIILSDGEVYILFPFSGEKAVKFTVDQNGTTVQEVTPLSIDEKEISRLIGEITEIYLEYYKSSAITVESGDITVYGMTASGKLITAELDSAALRGIFTDIANHIANDEYLCNQINEFARANNLNFTADDFKKSVTKHFNDVTLKDGDRLVIKTIVDNSNNVLAKSYTAYDGTESAFLAYVSGKDKSALEVGENEKAVISADMTGTSDSGTINIKYSGNGYPYAFKIDYEDASTAQFCGRSTPVGKYTLSFTPPADFTQNSDAEYRELLAAIGSSSLTLETKVVNEYYSFKMDFEVPQYGSVSLSTSITPKGESNALDIPTDALDITSIINYKGSYTDSDIKNINELVDILSGVRDKIASAGNSPIAGALCDEIDSLTEELKYVSDPKVDFSKVSELLSNISDMQYRAQSVKYQYTNVTDSSLDDRASALSDDYSALYDEIYDALYDSSNELSVDKYNEFLKRSSELNDKAEALFNEYEEASMNAIENVDYSDLSFDDLFLVLIDLESRFYDLTNNYADVIENDDDLFELYTTASDAYDTVYDDYVSMNDSIDSGNLSVPKLRKLRRSAEDFAKAVAALEAAVLNSSL